MSKLLETRPNLLGELLQRIKLACKVLLAPRYVVESQVGQLVTYDPVGKRLVIEGDFEIHATGNLILNSDKHVVVHSGNTAGQYTHGVWLNPDLEEEYTIHVDSDQSGSVGRPHLQSSSGCFCQESIDADAGDGEDPEASSENTSD